VRQAAGYETASGDDVPPAVVGAGVTGGDGVADLRLATAQRDDVYTIGADDEPSGRHASTVVFAADGRWPAPTLTLADPAPAFNSERTAAAQAAASCDEAAYTAHARQIRAAVARKEAALAALEDAIAQYVRANAVAASTLDAARAQLAAARLQPAEARAAVLQHYVMLRVLADNLRAGLEVDRASAQDMPTLEMCSNETKAGVEMLARCPPGWQLAQQQTAQATCHRPGGNGREHS
jgi:hypothetical protein